MASNTPFGAPGQPRQGSALLQLQFPQSLAVYDDYAAAQKAVDFLSDNHFPVENCMIVGTGKVAAGGALSGVWLGLFVGLIITIFSKSGTSAIATVLSTVLFGLVFGLVWALIGYAATRGQRDFSSVRAVLATRYEVLVEHKLLAQAQELLANLPGGRPNPFA
jgi:hypothetical protein